MSGYTGIRQHPHIMSFCEEPKFAPVQNRIALINKIEMQAKEQSDLWNYSARVQVNHSRGVKPLHERIIEAKLGNSRLSTREEKNHREPSDEYRKASDSKAT